MEDFWEDIIYSSFIYIFIIIVIAITIVIVIIILITLPETNSSPLKNRPSLKRKGSSSNHQFSGANC